MRGQQLLIELSCAQVLARPAPTAAREPLPPLLTPPTAPGFSEQAAVAIGCPQEGTLGAGPSTLLCFDQDVVSSLPEPHTPFTHRAWYWWDQLSCLPSARSLLEGRV